MGIRTKAAIQGNFETGDRPTQQNFADLIDTMVAIPTANATGLVEIEGTASSTTRAVGAFGVRMIEAAATASALNHLGLNTGDSPQFSAVNIGHASDTTLTRAAAGTIAVEGVNVLTTGTGRAQGRETIPWPAVAMYARTTSGAASGTTELSTNKNMVKSWDFDASSIEYIQFIIPEMPKSWNEGTMTAKFHWTAASGSGDVVWAIQAVALSNDDAMDVAFGTAVTATDTLTAANDKDTSPETSAMTVAGSPADGDAVMFQVYRNATDGADTLATDAKLLGVTLFFTTNASDDT